MTELHVSWSDSSAHSSLKDGEIHVWVTSLELSELRVAALKPLLTDHEQERAERFYFREDAQRFVIARATLRLILSRYLDVAPSELRFSYGAHGKPTLDEPFVNALKFNLSRSSELALYAITRDSEVGIDVERIAAEVEVDELAAGHFSSAESATLRALNKEEKSEAFFTYWVCKEAYLKATGQGLTVALDSFQVSPKESSIFIDREGCGLERSPWSLHQLLVPKGHKAALVTESASRVVRYFRC